MASLNRRDDADGEPRGWLMRAVETLVGSLSLQLVVLGVLFIGVGVVFKAGALAAIVPIWGAGAIIVGVSAYTLIWWSRR